MPNVSQPENCLYKTEIMCGIYMWGVTREQKRWRGGEKAGPP